jgi:PAS domain S-box-containing protein
MKKALSLISRHLPAYNPLKVVSRIFMSIMDIQQSVENSFPVLQSHTLLQYVIEHDHNAIALLDRDMRYIYVSKRFLSDYNVTVQDVLGKSHYDIFPDLPDRWKSVHQRALAGEVISADEDSFQRADGSVDWVRWECRPWFNDEGETGGIILYTEVITRQKETEIELIKAKERAEANEKMMAETLAKLNEAQNLAKIGSWDWNVRTGEVWWSDELYRIFEVDPAEYKPGSESNTSFVHPEDRAAYNEASLHSVKSGEPLDYQVRIITGKGNLKHCKSTATVQLDENGTVVRLTGTFSDISEHVEIVNELNAAKEKAEESDRLKTAFIQNMSHEVRTPLNSIVGFSELIAEPGQSLQKVKSFSKIISANSNKLIGIISDMIEISQIQSKQLKVVNTKFDVISLFYKVVDPFREIMQLKEVDFIVNQNIPEHGSIIISDKGKLEKIFYHLIDNAVKFTHKGSVTANLGLEGRTLQFGISDTGIGIEDGKQQIIFDPFRQVETGLSRSYGGTGLGLTIVKSYIDSLKGNIDLSSELNRGTTINITVPVDLEVSIDHTISNTAYEGPVNKILIAEDEYSNFKYLYEVLHSDRIEIIHANNGKEAIDICRNSDDIKMILMDIKMPVMDGTAAARQIKEFRPSLPIIAQTAYMPGEENINSIFDDLISKPINRSDLKRKMAKYINV